MRKCRERGNGDREKKRREGGNGDRETFPPSSTHLFLSNSTFFSHFLSIHGNSRECHKNLNIRIMRKPYNLSRPVSECKFVGFSPQ